MHPTLYELHLPLVGAVTFPAYMTFLVVGFAAAIGLARREEERAGRDADRVVDLGLIMIFFGLVGARVLSVLADGHLRDFVNLCVDSKRVPPFDASARLTVCNVAADCGLDYLCDGARHACYPPTDCLEVFKIWHGGLAYYGGFLAAAPIGMWYARRKGLGVWRTADLVAPLLALGLFFGRLGCFFNGCCYGRVTDLPWGVVFPGRTVAVHPTQLYEAAGALALYAALYLGVRPRKRAHGQVFAALLVGYGALRFVLEFWRDDERGVLLGLSTSQWIGLPLIALGAGLWVRRWR